MAYSKTKGRRWVLQILGDWFMDWYNYATKDVPTLVSKLKARVRRKSQTVAEIDKEAGGAEEDSSQDDQKVE